MIDADAPLLAAGNQNPTPATWDRQGLRRVRARRRIRIGRPVDRRTSEACRPVEVPGAERGIRSEDERHRMIRSARAFEVPYGLAPAAGAHRGLSQP